MAQVYNPTTGEWEEKPDEGTNAFSTGGATSNGPGLPTQIQQPAWSFDGGDWARQNESGIAQFKNLDGTWSDVGRGEHAESQGYIGSAVNDPNVDKLVAYQRANPNYLNNEQQSFFSNPIGMLDSYGQGNRWGLQKLFDNQFNPQQAGFLAQTGGRSYLSPSDIASGEAFNFRESAAEQSKRAEADGGFLGLGDMGIPLALAAMYFTGPAGAGLWGAEAGAGLAAGGMEGLAAADFAGGLIPEFGTSLGYSAGLGVGDGIGTLLGDPSYWASSLGDSYGLEGLSGISELPAAAELPSSVTNMEQGFRELSQLNNPTGWNSSPLNPEVSALENTGSNAFVDHGIQSPITKPYTPDYGTMADAEAAVNYGTTGESYPLGIDTLGSTNKFSSLLNTIRGGGMGMNDLAGLFKKPTPLELGVRGLGSLDSWIQGKKAQDVMEEQMNRMRGAEDSNAARGSAANDMWLRTQQDPMYGYDSFMQGAGRDFTNNARAAAAKSGSRGSYLNSGRMNSDLASLWQKNQTQRAASIAGGFSNSPYSSSSTLTPGYANLIKNQNAPLFQGLSGAMQGFKLADLFGGD
jgi:hypothetical protein